MKKIRPKTTFTGRQNSKCPLYAGQITVCDGNYGRTGWGGLAQVGWDGSGHTYYARAIQNNYYYVGSSAATVAYRQLVICQEIGHTLGLGHINVSYTTPNVGSCMDYTNDPDGGRGGVSQTDPNNMHPYAHDYAVINARHTHIGFLPPMAQTAMPPAAMLGLDPKTFETFGTLVYRANAGYTERYEQSFPGGWGMATWVIKPTAGR